MNGPTLKQAVIAVALVIAGCQTTEGEQALDWSSFPGDEQPGVLRADLFREIHDDGLAASNRLPSVATLACGPFQVEVRANPDSKGTRNNITEVSGRGALFNGFFLIIKAPTGFTDRVRFRQLFYPDLNARIFFNQDREWLDITNPERTYTPPMKSDTFQDFFLGFDPERHPYAFFDNTYVANSAWEPFITQSIYQNNYPYPEGRYRISFITPYEMEWPTGSCQFRLPDLEFTYREG
jgi:hypothetical protein